MPRIRFDTRRPSSFRFRADLLLALKDLARERREPLSRCAETLLQDFVSFFGVPRSMVELLERDRAETQLDRREYFRELLAARYRELLRHQR